MKELLRNRVILVVIAVALGGLGATLIGRTAPPTLAGSVGERPPKVFSYDLEPTTQAHEPVDVFWGDKVKFTCTSCPEGSSFKIAAIEPLKSKMLAQNPSEKLRELIDMLPALRPSAGQVVPANPFAGWGLPAQETGGVVTTPAVFGQLKDFGSSQMYALTWVLQDSSGAMQTFDPHIYVHGGLRR